jgi:hypothetical protein
MTSEPDKIKSDISTHLKEHLNNFILVCSGHHPYYDEFILPLNFMDTLLTNLKSILHKETIMENYKIIVSIRTEKEIYGRVCDKLYRTYLPKNKRNIIKKCNKFSKTKVVFSKSDEQNLIDFAIAYIINNILDQTDFLGGFDIDSVVTNIVNHTPTDIEEDFNRYVCGNNSKDIFKKFKTLQIEYNLDILFSKNQKILKQTLDDIHDYLVENHVFDKFETKECCKNKIHVLKLPIKLK